MNELRQFSTPLVDINEFLDDPIIINGDWRPFTVYIKIGKSNMIARFVNACENRFPVLNVFGTLAAESTDNSRLSVWHRKIFLNIEQLIKFNAPQLFEDLFHSLQLRLFQKTKTSARYLSLSCFLYFLFHFQ